jgi:hypothetical protein
MTAATKVPLRRDMPAAHTCERMIRFARSLVVGVVLVAVSPAAAVAKDGGDEVRVVRACGNGVTAKLRAKASDDGIEVRFEVDYGRRGVAWRVALVHERRVAWKGTVRTTRSGGSFEVRRTVPDFRGADTVSAQAWGPRGAVCRAAVTLPGE